MSKLRFRISMSLDGFVAGPSQSVANPLGIGGMRLYEWAFPLAVWRAPQGLEGGEVNASTPVVEESLANIGWPPASWTSWKSTSRRRSSAAVSDCSMASAPICTGSSSCGRWLRPK